MGKKSIIKEVDGLQESLKMMQAYERMFGISSVEFMNGVCTVDIPEMEKYIWAFYIECYKECGGIFEHVPDVKCAVECAKLEDTISAKNFTELIMSEDTERGRDYKLSLPLFLFFY